MATEVVHSIKADGSGDYTDLLAWEAAQQRDLVSLDEVAVAEVYGETIVGKFDIGGWIHDSTHYCLVRAATGEEYNPLANTGAVLNHTDSGIFLIPRAGHILHIDNLGIKAPILSVNFVYTQHDRIYFNACVLFQCISFSLTRSTLNNCLIHDFLSTGSQNPVDAVAADTYLNNTTVICKSGRSRAGLVIRKGTLTNVAVYNEDSKSSFDTCYATNNPTTCAQNNNGSIALPAGNINNLLTTDFTDYVNSDYSVAQTVYDVDGVTVLSKSQLLDAGTDLSAQFTTDIIGTVRG